MPSEAHLAKMRLFNDKVNLLKRSKFKQAMFAGKTGVTLTWDDKGATIDFRGPVGDDVDAMVLTLRFMIQQRDGISLPQMQELYQSLGDEVPARDRFLKAVPIIEAELAKPAMPHLLGKATNPQTGETTTEKELTNLELLEHVIYGEKAHTNADKAARVQFMRQTRETSALLDMAFNSAAVDLMRGLFFLQHHNAILYQHYTGVSLDVHEPGRG